MSEYPKQMRHPDYGEVEMWGPPDIDGDQPYRRWVGPYKDPNWGFSDRLAPLPSPDDEVEVVVKMTRAQRDRLAEGWLMTFDLLRDACRAHQEAEV